MANPRRVAPVVALSAAVFQKAWLLPVGIDGDVGADYAAEDSEHLAGLGVPAGGVLGVDEVPVDDDFEGAVVTGDQSKFLDDVLVVAQQVADRAHGVGGIISGDAVGDLDVVCHGGDASREPSGR